MVGFPTPVHLSIGRLPAPAREDLRQIIRDAAAENRDLISERGGRVTDGHVINLAEAAGLPEAMSIVAKRVKGQASKGGRLDG